MSELHFNCQTTKTKTGKRDMKNRRPFRSAHLKEQAMKESKKTERGSFISLVPRQYH